MGAIHEPSDLLARLARRDCDAVVTEGGDPEVVNRFIERVTQAGSDVLLILIGGDPGAERVARRKAVIGLSYTRHCRTGLPKAPRSRPSHPNREVVYDSVAAST